MICIVATNLLLTLDSRVMCVFQSFVGKAKGIIISVSGVDDKICFKNSLAIQLVQQQQSIIKTFIQMKLYEDIHK